MSETVEELRQLVYMPGDWVCDKCGFEQHNRTLHARDGQVSAPRLEEIQTCPNDGQPMRRMTWKEGCESNYVAALRFMTDHDEVSKMARHIAQHGGPESRRFYGDHACGECIQEFHLHDSRRPEEQPFVCAFHLAGKIVKERGLVII